MRLIDTDALKKHIIEIFEIKERFDKKWATGLKYSLKIIDNAPTVEITETEIQEVLNKRCMTAVANEYLIDLQNNRAKAEWINHREVYDDGRKKYHTCSNCGTEIVETDYDNYCSCCGAKMKRREAENE